MDYYIFYCCIELLVIQGVFHLSVNKLTNHWVENAVEKIVNMMIWIEAALWSDQDQLDTVYQTVKHVYNVCIS